MVNVQLTQAEILAQETFSALMWALSHPGEVQSMPPDVAATPQSFLAVGRTLLDLETSFFSPDENLAGALTATRARALSANEAAYQFYPHWDDNTLTYLAQAPVGTMAYPDQAATLILPARFGSGQTFTWYGPGIQNERRLQLAGVPPGFWELRRQTRRYPLGWDVFFLDGLQVIGLPRSTETDH